jgi:tetratricopeptide (TPR) repeat protein
MLNEIQKQLLSNLFKTYILDKLEESTAYNTLCALTNDSIFNQHKKTFERLHILENIEYFRNILQHPYPQNVAVSQEDVPSDSVVKYRDFKGNFIIEPKGILGLTSLNDDTVTEPVTRRDVFNFIHSIIEKEALQRMPQEDIIDLDNETPAVAEVVGESPLHAPNVLLSSIPPTFEGLSPETQQYWLSLVALLKSEKLFADYNEVKNIWSSFKEDVQQKVVIEMQSMVAECLILYDVLINILLKFGIARTRKNFNASDFSDFIYTLNQEQNSHAQANLLCISYFSRAFVYFKDQNFEEAIQDYTKTAALTEDSVVYNNRGMCYYNLKKINEAIKDFTIAIKMKPDYAMPYFNRSLCYEEMNQIWEAQQDAKKAYLLQTSNTDYQARYKTLRNLIESLL